MARGGELKKVSDLFAKYKNTLRAPQESVESACREVVEDLYAVKLKPEAVSYTPGTRVLHLRTHATIRQELLMHKQEILNHLKGRLGEKSAPKDVI